MKITNKQVRNELFGNAEYDALYNELKTKLNNALKHWVYDVDMIAIVNQMKWMDLPPAQRMHAIYDFVCEHFEYQYIPNYEFPPTPPYNSVNIYNKHYGNSFDIALVLTCFLRIAEIDATLTLFLYQLVEDEESFRGMELGKRGKVWHHCSVLANIEGQLDENGEKIWIPLDATLGKTRYMQKIDTKEIDKFEPVYLKSVIS